MVRTRKLGKKHAACLVRTMDQTTNFSFIKNIYHLIELFYINVHYDMNFLVNLSFNYKPSSLSVKIVHDLLFVEAREFSGVKGVDCTKRCVKTCKKIVLPTSQKVLAFYKKGKVRIVDSGQKRRGETEIPVNVTRAKVMTPKYNFGTPSRVSFMDFKESLRLMGINIS